MSLLRALPLVSGFLLAKPGVARESRIPESEAATDSSLPSPRFELGARAAAAPGAEGLENSLKLFGGMAGSYALTPWFAIGAEVEALQVVSISDHGMWVETCPSYVEGGVQTLAAAELRVPLGLEALEPFGRI